MAQFWERFPLDPNMNRGIRASDMERDLAADELREAHADGRLDIAEYQERLDSAMTARTLGELADLLDDLAPKGSPPAPVAAGRGTHERRLEAQAHWRRTFTSVVSNWAFVALITNLIWLFTAQGHGYYWPAWPMLGLAFPVIGTLASRGEIIGKYELRLEHKDRRALERRKRQD